MEDSLLFAVGALRGVLFALWVHWGDAYDDAAECCYLFLSTVQELPKAFEGVVLCAWAFELHQFHHHFPALCVCVCARACACVHERMPFPPPMLMTIYDTRVQ